MLGSSRDFQDVGLNALSLAGCPICSRGPALEPKITSSLFVVSEVVAAPCSRG